MDEATLYRLKNRVFLWPVRFCTARGEWKFLAYFLSRDAAEEFCRNQDRPAQCSVGERESFIREV